MSEAELPEKNNSPKKSTLPSDGGAMVKALYKVVPSLWQKVDPSTSTLAEQRTRLITLITWFANKNSWGATTPIPQRYSDKGRHIAGRISMQIEQEGNKIKIEVAFSITKSIALKLKAAQQDNSKVILVTKDSSAKTNIANQLNEPTPWLTIITLI